MTQTVTLNLPLRLQCLRVPVKWTRSFEGGEWWYAGETFDGPIETYDPRQARLEFLQLRIGDSDALFALVQKYGLFDRAGIDDVESDPNVAYVNRLPIEARDQARRVEDTFWEYQRLLRDEMLEGKTFSVADKQHEDPWRTEGLFGSFEFHALFLTNVKRNAGIIIRTICLLEAIAFTVLVDRLLNAKVRKCKRQDCTGLVATTNRKQKYCQWYCGHIEAVRSQRKAKKSLKKGRKV